MTLKETRVRLQKFLAECGVASRRKAEVLIRAEKVKVNGVLVRGAELGVRINPLQDRVEVNGLPVSLPGKKVYLKLNKPRGYVSSARSQRGEQTIFDLVKDVPYRLFPVGRLDKESEGLMILTNDGALANRLMHPRYEHEKEYLVKVQLTINNEQLRSFESGILIDGRKTLPAKVKRIGENSFSIVLREGKKRQIRRMVEAVGNKVVQLTRIRINNVKLGYLNSGKHAFLTAIEIHNLLSS